MIREDFTVYFLSTKFFKIFKKFMLIFFDFFDFLKIKISHFKLNAFE